VARGVCAPDYCFRVGGTGKLFVQVKKSSLHLSSDIGPACRLRRCAWSGKLPLSLLPDLEEMALYDIQAKSDAD